MRNALFLAGTLLLASLSAIPAAGAPPYQDVQPTTNTIAYDFETGAQGWTTSKTGSGSNEWRRINDGGDMVFAATGGTAASPGPYEDDMTVTLLSPMIDLRNQRLEAASVQIKGSSHETDELQIDVRPLLEVSGAAGDARWRNLATLQEATDGYDAIDLKGPLDTLGWAFDVRFQLRFVFVTVAPCDGSSPAAPSDVNPIPTQDFQDCFGQDDHMGWYVDDVTLTGRPFVLTNPSTRFLATFEGGSAFTVSPDAETPAQTWRLCSDGRGGQAYFASDTCASGGYMHNVSTTLTSPIFDLDGLRLRSIQYEVQGGGSNDTLSVQVKIAGTWRTLATHAGASLADLGGSSDPAVADGFLQMRLRDDKAFVLMANHPFDRTLQVRFSFTSSAGQAEGEGFMVDNVAYDAWTIPTNTPPGVDVLPFAYPATQDSITSVHAADEAGAFIGFDLDKTRLDQQRAGAGQTALGDLHTATVQLTHSSGYVLSRALQRSVADDGSVHWFSAMAVSEPDLLLGTHQVVFRYTTAGGAAGVTEARTLTVQGTDAAAPAITAVNDPPEIVSANGLVRFEVVDQFLRRVTYTHDDLAAPQTLTSPYIIRAQQLPEGPTTLTVTATDRAGKSTTITHEVVKDTTPPEVNITLEQIAYQSLPYIVKVAVDDDTGTVVTFRLGENVTTRTVPVGGGNATLELTPEELGEQTIDISVRDDAGNRVLHTRTFAVEQVEADIGIAALTASDGPFLAGDSVTIMAELVQHDGLIDIPTNLTLAAPAGNRAELQTSVPADGSAELTWSTSRLAAGRQTIQASLEVPSAVIELDDSNDTASVDVEVFVGRTDHGDTSYHIRVSDVFGLPLEAVELESGSTFRLQVPDASTERVYRFQDGDLDLYWDPLSPITVIPVDETEPAPGVGLFSVLALLGAAAAMRRRD